MTFIAALLGVALAPLGVGLAQAVGGQMQTLDGNGPFFVGGAVPVDASGEYDLALMLPWIPATGGGFSLGGIGYAAASLTLDATHFTDLSTVLEGVAVCPAAIAGDIPAISAGCQDLTPAGDCANGVGPADPAAYCLEIAPFTLVGTSPVPANTFAIRFGFGNHETSILLRLALLGPIVPGDSAPMTARFHAGVSGQDAAEADVQFTIAPGPLSSFAFTLPSDETIAGEGLPAFTVTAYDAFGNIKTDYDGAVTLTTSDPRGLVLSPVARFDGATHTFDGETVTLATAGAQTLTLCDRAAAVCAESPSLTVLPGEIVRAQIQNSGDVPELAPIVVVGEQASTWRVMGFDRFDNAIPTTTADWTVTTLAGTPCGSVDSGLLHENTFTAGRSTTDLSLSALLTTPVVCRVVADVDGSISATTGPITVRQGALATLVIRDQPNGGGAEVGAINITADDVAPFFAAAYDAAGNYIADVTAAWIVTGACGVLRPQQLTPGVMFDATTVTDGADECLVTASTGAAEAEVSASTGEITVTPGAVRTLEIRDAAGDPVASLHMGLGAHVALSVVGLDLDGNLVGPAMARWAATGVSGADLSCGVFDGELAASSSDRRYEASPVPTITLDASPLGAAPLVLPATSTCNIIVVVAGAAPLAIPVTTKAVAQIDISPADLAFVATDEGETLYGVRAYADDGSELRVDSIIDIAWSISPVEGAFVENVLTRPTTADEYEIAASYVPVPGSIGRTSLIVAPGDLTAFTLDCPDDAVVGQDQTCTVAAEDQFGNPTAAGTVAWTAVDITASELTIVDGTFTAPSLVGSGPVTVTATIDGIGSETEEIGLVADDLARITVTGDGSIVAGATKEYALAGFDQYDNPVALQSTSIHYTAGLVAPATETVSYNEVDITGEKIVSVTVDALALIDITGDPTIVANTTKTYTLAGFDRYGNSVGLAAQTVEHKAGTVAPAVETVRYIESNITGTLDVNVVVDGLHSITVTGDDTLTAGTTKTYDLAGFDQYQNAIVLAQATIDHTAGTVAPATENVTYNEGGVVGVKTVSVTPDALFGITVTGDSSIAAGTTKTYLLAGFDQYGNSVALAQPSLDHTAGIEADATEMVSYSEDGVTGNLDVTVIADVLANITITGDDSLVAGTTKTYALAGFDKYGNPVALDQNTLDFTAGTLAPTTQNVTYEKAGIQGHKEVSVLVDVLHHFSVTCNSPVTPGSTSACSATARDQYENARGEIPSWNTTAGYFFSNSGASTTYAPPTTVGTYSVTASFGNIGSPATVQVVPGNLFTYDVTPSASTNVNADIASIMLTATPRDFHGNLLGSGVRVHFILDDPGAANAGTASLSAASSLTNEAGVASVTLTTSTRAGDDYRVRVANDPVDFTISKLTGVITVTPGALAAFVTTCDPAAATVGTDVTCAASAGTDRHGNARSIGPVVWVASDSSGNDVSITEGAFSAPQDLAAGPIVVLATAADVSSTTDVALVSDALASFTLACPAAVTVGTDVTCSVSDGLDQYGNPQALGTPSWSATDAQAGSLVVTDGAFTAPAEAARGPLNVSVTIDGVPRTAVVETIEDVLATFALTCEPASAVVGTDVLCRVDAGSDQHGNPQAIGVVSWRVTDAAGDDIEVNDGAFGAPTDLARGPLTIIATADDVTQTSELALVADILVSFTVGCPDTATVGADVSCAAEGGLDQYGNPQALGTVVWGVQDVEAVDVEVDGGAFTAPTDLARGPLTVSAEASGVWANAQVALAADALAAFTLTCAPADAIVGTPVACSATDGQDAYGNTRAIGPVTWTALDAGANSVEITDGGFIAPTLVAAGPVAVTATANGIPQSFDVLLAADVLFAFVLGCDPDSSTVGAPVQCSATDGVDQYGNLQAIGPVTWSVEDAAGGSISVTDGAFTAPTDLALGPLSVSAEASAVVRDLVVLLEADELVAFTLACPESVTVGTGVACSASDGVDAHGNAQDIGVVTWSAFDVDDLDISITEGAFTAPTLAARGPIRISAVANDIENVAFTALAVDALSSFTLVCTPATAVVGTGVDCDASDGVDQHGNPQAIGTLTWDVTDALGGPVTDIEGAFTAPSEIGLGPLAISATADGITETFTVDLEADVLASFTLVCSPEAPVVGASIECAASDGVDQYGNSQAMGALDWMVTDAADVPVEVTGGAFVAPVSLDRSPLSVEATTLGVTRQLTLVLGAAPLFSFTLTCPEAATVGTTLACTAGDGADEHGNPQSLGTVVWTATDAADGSLLIADGEFTAPTLVTGGPVAISATAEGVENTASVALEADVLASFEVLCEPEAAVAGADVACSVTNGLDQYGNPQAIGAVVWTVTDSQDGTISTTEGAFIAPSDVELGPLGITANAGGVVETRTLALGADVLSAFTLSCTPTATVGTSVECHAEGGVDGNGNPQTIGELTWTATDAAESALDILGGAFLAPTIVGDGPIEVTATADGVTRSATVGLLVDALDSFALTCTPETAVVGTAVECAAADGVDQYGNAQTIGTLTWTVTDAAQDAISTSEGVFIAPTDLSVAPLLVTASADGVTETVGVALAPDVLVSFTLDCGEASTVGADVTCFATEGLDQYANVRAIGPIEWSASDGAAGPISITDGAFTAPTNVDVGPVAIGADAGGVTQTAEVVLRVDVLDHFAVSCVSPVRPGETSECSAEARDQFENLRSDIPRWTAVSGGFSAGSALSTTYYPPTTAATYVVRAVNGSVSTPFDVVVSPGELMGFTIAPAFGTTNDIDADLREYTVTATGFDGVGNSVGSGIPFYWELLDPNGANGGAGATLSAPSSETDGNGQATILLTTSTRAGDDYRVRVADDPDEPTMLKTTGTLRVVAGALASFDLACLPESVVVGTAVDCEVVGGVDQHGNPRAIGPVEWAVTDAQGGTIDVTGGAFVAPTDATRGPLTVTASASGVVVPMSIVLVVDDLFGFTLACSPETVTVGEGVDCVATDGVDQFGNARPIGDVSWSITDASAAVIAVASGFTAPTDIAAGPLSVTASAGDVTEVATVDLIEDALAAFTLVCVPDTATVGTTVDCSATEGQDQYGNPQDLGEIEWTIVDGRGDPHILVEGSFVAPTDVAASPVTVTALAGGITNDVVIVLAPDVLVDFAVVCLPDTATAGDETVCSAVDGVDRYGNAQLIGEVTWSAVDATDANIPIAGGVFTAPTDVGLGPLSISAHAGDITSALEVALVADALAAYTLTCTPEDAIVGTLVGCAATDGVDQYGNAHAIGTVTWTVTDALDDPIGAPSGAFTAPTDVAQSPITVSSTVDGVTVEMQVVLLADVLSAFVLACEPSTAAVATDVACSATDGVDQYGNAQVLGAIEWTATDSAEGPIDITDGAFTAPADVARSPLTITAAASGVTQEVEVALVAGPLESFVLACAPATATVATEVACAATDGVDFYGNPQSVGTVVWSVLDATDSEIDVTEGLFTAPTDVALGPLAVVATASGVSVGVEVALVADVLDSFTLACLPVPAVAGGEVTCSATDGADIHGNEQAIGTLEWAVLDALEDAVAVVDGAFTAPTDVGRGPLGVTATASGVTMDLALGVVADAASQVVFRDPPSVVFAGECTALSVEVQDQFGNPSLADGHLLTLADGAGAGAFYAAGGCDDVITEITIEQGTATAGLFYMSVLDEDVTLEIAEDGVISAAVHGLEIHPATLATFALACTGECASGAGDAIGVVITAKDEYDNSIVRGTNSETLPGALTFSGAANSPAGDEPACGDVVFGEETAVVFTAGTATISCTFYAAETASLGVTDGAVAESGALDIIVASGDAATFVVTLPGQTFDAATGLSAGAPDALTAGGAFVFSVRALDAYGNLATSHVGDRTLTFAGVNAAFTGEIPQVAGGDIGVDVIVTFADGLAADVPATLYRQGIVALSLAEVDGPAGTATSVTVNPAADAAALAIVKNCTLAAAQTERSCVIRSTTVDATELLSTDSTPIYRSAAVDAYDNVRTGALTLTWTGDGDAAAGFSATAAGVVFVPTDVGSGTITLTKTGYTTLVLTIEVS